MMAGEDTELIDSFESFYRDYYHKEIGQLARKYPNDKKSLYLNWSDLYQFDPELADNYLSKPEQYRQYAEEALRLYDLPVDVKLGGAHVRIRNIREATDIRDIRATDVNRLVSVQGIVRKATDVRPKIQKAAFKCQRCETLTHVDQSGGSFQEPHECRACERQGPFILNEDQSEFVDSQQLRVQESPEGLRGGETPQSIDVDIEDDITGQVSPGDRVRVTGILRLDQDGGNDSPIFDVYIEGRTVEIEEEEFEDMDITDEDKQAIVELSNDPDIYEKMVDSIAPSIHGYRTEKLAMTLQLFSGVTKHLPDESRIRGDLHILLIGDPGTGKSQLLQYIRNIAPRSVYTSGKGSSSAGLTAAAVRDDFGEGQQWTLEAGALVLADQGVAAVDELDKMRCVTGDSLVRLGDNSLSRIRDLSLDAAQHGQIEALPNGRTIRDVDLTVWTLTDNGSLVKRPVTAIHEYDAPQELTQVTLESGETVVTTDDHPFFVIDSGKRTTCPASELQSGEWALVPQNIPTHVTDGGVATCSPASQSDEFDTSVSHGKLLGYLLAGGNVSYNGQLDEYTLTFSGSKTELSDAFRQASQDVFGISQIESSQANELIVRVPASQYVDTVFDTVLTLNANSIELLPPDITSLSRDTQAAFVRALADVNGYVNTSTPSVNISSESRDLLQGIKSVLLDFDITSQLRSSFNNSDSYTLYIPSTEIHQYRQQIGFSCPQKQSALDVACNETDSHTNTELIPDIGDLLSEYRQSLRLRSNECGVPESVYQEAECDDIAISLYDARQILNAFKQRTQEAAADLTSIQNECTWDQINAYIEKYDIAWSDVIDESQISTDQLSTLWDTDEMFRQTVRNQVADIISSVAETDLSAFYSLVHGDVTWRRVRTVEAVTQSGATNRSGTLRRELADLVDYDGDNVVDYCYRLLTREIKIESWRDFRAELDRYNISVWEIADDLEVTEPVLQQWVSENAQSKRFERARESITSHIRSTQQQIKDLIGQIRQSERSKVYDLTVEQTHNFVANGMVVHNSEDRSAMHEALEQQSISVSKAGINATLKSRCSLLGAANPKYGRFDQYEPIGEQIDLEPALVSRFDLIFTVTDQPDPDEDRELAEHILDANYAGQLNTQRQELPAPDISKADVENVQETVEPEIDAELLRKYVAYAQQSCYPRLTDDAKKEIEDFYVDLRSKGASEDAPVPVTARKLEALVRLTEASARVRLSDKATKEDAQKVINIVRTSLQDISVDPETGEFDADVVETGHSKSQRDRKKNITDIIEDMQEEYENGAPVEAILDRAEEVGLERSKAESEIEKLKRNGSLYEPQNGHIRVP
nr:LAGLIDADG family homing endonuclease [Salinarchaeum sp. IM2453]